MYMEHVSDVRGMFCNFCWISSTYALCDSFPDTARKHDHKSSVLHYFAFALMK